MKRKLWDLLLSKLIKNYNRRRKIFMWCYGLGEEDMINDITPPGYL